MKPFYASKTIWMAVFQACAGILVAVSAQYPEVGGILIAKSVIDIILRLASTDTIGTPLE